MGRVSVRRVHAARIARRCMAFVVALATAVVVALVAAPASLALGTPSSLTHASSAHADRTAVVGRTSAAVVYNDLSRNVVYLANPGGAGAPIVFARDARAVAASGDLVEYRVGDALLWRDVGTGAHGTVPSGWTYLAPDGGMRIGQVRGRTVLDYLHRDGSVQHLALPNGFPADGARYSVVAGGSGAAVAATATGAAPTVAFSTLRRGSAFHALDTRGVKGGHTLTCESVSDTAIGCVSPTQVVRLATNGHRAPQVISSARRPFGVAVTDGYTSWTTAHAPRHGSCTCDLASIDRSGSSVSVVAGLTSGAVVSGGGRFFYSSGTRYGRAGVFVDLAAGGGDKLIARAARRPLSAGIPVLATGRAVWADDSRPTGALWAHAVRNGTAHGKAYHQATGAVPSGRVAASGPRSAYAGRDGALHVVTGRHDRVVAHGLLIGLSGTRLLFANPQHRLVLLDLASDRRTDETAAHGAVTGSIFGPYLSYLRGDGSVWRVDVRAGKHRVELSGAVSGDAVAAGSQVYSWGNWTAWSVRTGGGSTVSAWRDARRGRTHMLPAGTKLTGASIGGPVVARSNGSADFALLSWRTGAVRADLPGSGQAPTVDAGTVGWLRGGIPTVASIGVAIANRPRLLGARSAAHVVTRGRTWRFELPTSAPLTHCSFTLRHGHYRRTLPCGPVWRSRGDALVHWHTRSAPVGRYRWTLAASGADGSVLGYAGGHRSISGQVVVTRR